jgi:pimeloyl-ACP methyl ester carboxylesterase
VQGRRARLLEGLPLRERRVEVDGLGTALLEGGDGPPLLLLHGGIECGGAYWAPVIERLAERHRLVVPDVPGLGESAPADRLEARFDGWLAALIDATCPDPPVIVAHSLIGSLAARFAPARGGLLRQLVVYGAPGIGPYRQPLGLMAVAILFALRPSVRSLERFARWAFLEVERTRSRDPEWLSAFMDYVVERSRVSHVKRTMQRLLKVGMTRIPDEELARIPVPAALIWGRHDRMVPLTLAEGASSRLGWPLRVIDAAGHVPHIEQPEAFDAALRSLLS